MDRRPRPEQRPAVGALSAHASLLLAKRPRALRWHGIHQPVLGTAAP